MAMDALNNLIANVPDWLQRLDDLSGQIDRRQAELAAVAAAEGKSAETKSLRNKGSNESLKPNDNPPPTNAEDPANENMSGNNPVENVAQTPVKTPETPKEYTPSPRSIRQQQEIIKAAQATARAQVRKKSKSPSMISHGEKPAPYRFGIGTIVYYDSYVGGFFDELVRFLSSSRNLMRKAKMAARVAEIKKLAEQDVSEDDNNDDPPLLLRYRSTRGPGVMSTSGSGASGQPPGVYDNMDKGLEFVQSICEHGAHQFVCDGDCNDEINKARKRLGEVLEMAETEMGRVQREVIEPAEAEMERYLGKVLKLVKSMMEHFVGKVLQLGKVRTRRDISKRSCTSVDLGKESTKKLKYDRPKNTEPATLWDPMAPIEVDPDYLVNDKDVDDKVELPKLQYRSTRAMTSRGSG
ncbi:hypothetical protein FHETE_10510 [Fusarium heterosporum]|uniref:Uncharacterized protein n=1 Tax=Fusarium heterosporum TaxID=42747 RepID=A0A8H5WCE5_FUSHE|nr:hypothetical protein FHETE_10510 [Fusarium heterosporum]